MRKYVIIAIAILIFTTSIFAAQGISEIVSEKSIDQSLLINKELVLTNSDALKALKAKMKKVKNSQQQIESYAYFISVLKPTSEEKTYIDKLIKNGYDAEALIDIYEFWLDTSEDINIIEKVYANKPEDLNIRYWIDESFIKLSSDGETKSIFCDMTYDEVNEYYNAGIELDEIRLADRLSRKGVKGLTSILNEKKEGISWYEIVDEVYSLSSDPSNNNVTRLENYKEKYKTIKDGNTVFNCIQISKLKGESVYRYLDSVLEGENIVNEYAKAKNSLINEAKVQLKAQNLWTTEDVKDANEISNNSL